jgi:multicomponent Na+:H+ antiporter subunit B
MNSLVLRTAISFLLPLLMLFSWYLLIRGHNEPGGGFVGGLVAAAAITVYALAHGLDAARRVLSVDPRTLIAAGLAVAFAAGLLGMILAGAPFLTGVWATFEVPGIGKLGTPLMFDIGVYLLVSGVSLLIVFVLMEP